ncbi:MAG: hypothetical protein H7Z41_17440 [Cytophagales bacterium]|nr:hypothetical protein [Armatimonadota bacterium]
MLYETLLVIGAVGLLAQTVLGMGGHGSGHSHVGADHGGTMGHGGHGHGIDLEVPHLSGGHGGTVPGAPAAGHGGQGPLNSVHLHGEGHGHAAMQQRTTAALWQVFSPLTIFSVCLGAGATGLLTRAFLGTSLLVALAAVAGGLLFYGGLVRPLWGLIFKFASRPAQTLGGVVAGEAVAMGRFDAQGQGIVRVTIDNEVVRLLARLETEDRDKGVAVLSGDTLVVTSVDEKRNTCRVTRL